MPMLQPTEIDTVRKEFLMLPEELRMGIPENDTIAMQQAVEASKAKAALGNDPQSPAVQWRTQLQQTMNDVDNLERGTAMASGKFNLKKHAQGMGFNPATPNDMFGAETSPAGVGAEQNFMQANDPNMQQDTGPQTQFNDASQLKQALDSCPNGLNDLQQQNPQLYEAFAQNEDAKGILTRYWTIQGDEDRLKAAQGLYEFLPPNMQSNQPDNSPEDGMNVPAQFTQADVSSYLNQITASIKEVADKVGTARRQKQAKSFNLKTAQHATVNQAIMWGPMETRPDPFLRGQPVSDWHIIERNKGFGRDIDWEAVWRGNVMDKYSRPYRDTTTGEWVGGYIQKRFEVDKNIPETNNYQLLPGERRKPYLAEYGSTEARLQAMRSKDDGHLGRQFNDTSKPFNWRKASAEGLIKTSQRSQHPLWMEDGDQHADKIVEDAMGTAQPQGMTDIINDDFSNLDMPSETGLPPGSDLDPTLYALLNPQAHHPGKSALEMGDVYDAGGFNPDQIGNEDAASRMKARQMTREMAGLGGVASAATPVTTGVAPVDSEAQTDVTTERQLANAARRPGVLGQPSIQRHEQDEPELEKGSDYRNNYGDEIKNKSAEGGPKVLISEGFRAAVKKKQPVKPELVDPIRR